MSFSSSTPTCAFCERELRDGAFEYNDVFLYTIARLQSPGQAEVVGGERLCGVCADEVLELVDDFEPADIDSYPVDAGEEWWSVETCGFCDGDLDQERGAFIQGWEGTGTDTYHALCTNCLSTVDSFLENVPEDPPEGDFFVGRSGHEVKTHRDEADKKAINKTAGDVSKGDTVYFEVHLPGGDKYPDLYAEGTGTVVVDHTSGLGRRVIMDPEDDDGTNYEFYDLLQEDHSLKASINRSDSPSVDGGTVTAMSIVEKSGDQ